MMSDQDPHASEWNVDVDRQARTTLTSQARRILAVLAGLDDGEVPAPLVAAHAGVSTATARRHLQHLSRIGLVQAGKAEPDTFRIAAGLVAPRPAPPTDAGWARAGAWQLGCVFQAARVLGAAALPGGEQLSPDPDRPPRVPAGRAQALAWFVGERDRLTATLEHASQVGEDDAGAWRLSLLMLNIACFAGPWPAWTRVFHLGMRAARGARHRGARAMLLEYAGKLKLTGGDPSSARRFHQASLKIRVEEGDTVAVVRSINALGVVNLRCGELPEAEVMFEQTLDLAQAAGDEEFGTFALMNLGAVHARNGNAERATQELGEAVRALRRAGREVYVANALEDLAAAHRIAGDLPGALEAALDAEHEATDAGVPMFLPGPLIELAAIHAADGHRSVALARLDEALAVYEEIGDEMRVARTRTLITSLLGHQADRRDPATDAPLD